MNVRIIDTFAEGSVQFSHGDVIIVPDEIGQKLIDDGRAEETKDVPHLTPDISGFVPPARRVQKGKRR